MRRYHRTEPLRFGIIAIVGSGESPYLKCITQLFGEQMMVASRKATNNAFFKSNEVSNATGCSSIYGGEQSQMQFFHFRLALKKFSILSKGITLSLPPS